MPHILARQIEMIAQFADAFAHAANVVEQRADLFLDDMGVLAHLHVARSTACIVVTASHSRCGETMATLASRARAMISGKP